MVGRLLEKTSPPSGFPALGPPPGQVRNALPVMIPSTYQIGTVRIQFALVVDQRWKGSRLTSNLTHPSIIGSQTDAGLVKEPRNLDVRRSFDELTAYNEQIWMCVAVNGHETTYTAVRVPGGIIRAPCPLLVQYATAVASMSPVRELGTGAPQIQKSATPRVSGTSLKEDVLTIDRIEESSLTHRIRSFLSNRENSRRDSSEQNTLL